ncbi:MAG: DEAD/DEAH box helicase [Actinomycetia bacterium]|nr:DEAD/DEAH box helicase [Actinomycetes bacterium]
MNVFDLHGRLIEDYRLYVDSFIQIKDERIRDKVDREIDEGLLWPAPLVQLNPSFESGGLIGDLVGEGILHPECERIFRVGKDKDGAGTPIALHRHQTEAIRAAAGGDDYVLTTGTGSGKSLAYLIPIVDSVLREGSGKGIRAIVVYPMNALANSQAGELRKFLCDGYPDGKGPVTFRRYTGQESDEERLEIIGSPPDILLTNYVMLELILTRPREEGLIGAAQGLRFLVLDELHTYRGRQGADVAYLVRRVRDRLAPQGLQVVGTSATLAGTGSYDEQRAEVARVASQLFGAPVKPERVIGETLRRASVPADVHDKAFIAALHESLLDEMAPVPDRYEEFLTHPLSRWIEGALGVEPDLESGRLVRVQPKSITGQTGVARDLAALTGVPEEICADRIADFLLGAGCCQRDPVTGFPPFAFRLHQFISRGDAVYASVGPEQTRYLTTNAQQFVPGSRDKVLLPLAFCRECGQEYYVVRAAQGSDGGRVFSPRSVSERVREDDGTAGFLYLDTKKPWPEDAEAILDRLPEDWIEAVNGDRKVRKDRVKKLPQLIRLLPNGSSGADDEGVACHFVPAPFGFCLSCGVSYAGRIGDFAKLGQLGSEGRSTATTILGLTAVRSLRSDTDLHPRARKLLSFTDNRQDASLQAGHFNDFVEVGLLRSALYRAAEEAGKAGIRHDQLTQKVFDALELPLEQYAADSTVKFAALANTQAALRNVLGYRLYRDLQKGWRVTLPNLEQCGLLNIEYESLAELCAAGDEWAGAHEALVSATPATRAAVADTMLDWMRRGLAIKVDYLRGEWQEGLKQQSSQHLSPPWAIDEQERLETSRVVFPRSRRRDDSGGDLFLSGRSGFGQYLRRSSTLPGYGPKLSVANAETIIRQLLAILRRAGLVEPVIEGKNGEVSGYQIPAAALIWKAGDGTTPYHDPIRVPRLPAGGGRTNSFFLGFYKKTARGIAGIEAREHTAQVAYEAREEREQRFREGTLPILFCSPTMELGVDIAELNVVNMRNVPPNPANYAQRSGRAGRSGQPALVYSYCSTGSPHDQYFFKRPELMVAGAVTPPRLDLANEDLIRAHVHAVWLAETDLSLGKSLKDILDLSGDEPTLALQEHVWAAIEAKRPLDRARVRAAAILEGCRAELEAADWYSEGWLDEVLDQVALRFDRACDRWRDLYRSALAQFKAQNKLITDPTRSAQDKALAKRLRGEAEQQMNLLTDVDKLLQSDFYSYRYFASEGFLPGYSFPRLPLSAFIPGRKAGRGGRGQEEFLSRPRFLAISEFGPRAIVYHEGSQYVINKAILPVKEGEDLAQNRAKICPQCGYLHQFDEGDGPDLCQSCGVYLDQAITNLFRLQNVSTRRRDRISSDEEERMRLGYELATAVRLGHDGVKMHGSTAMVTAGGTGEPVAKLTYGHAALIWRINKGWARRKNKEQLGFVLDIERGYWAKNQEDDLDDDDQDPLSPRTTRVIPYVEDRRNCLLIDMTAPLSPAENASLQAALKRAIQALYQLEDNELAVESLPNDADPRRILLYEAAEGGAGVLRQLLNPGALGAVAREALALCHFDPGTGDDLRRGPRAKEDCEAACYDCLMSYQNQRYHHLLDRQSIRELLLRLRDSAVEASPTTLTRAEHLQILMNQAGSNLERRWLQMLEEQNLHLPSHAQKLIEVCGTRPDFLYETEQVAVYIDGPPHDFPERQERDAAQTAAMEDYGYTVVRFHHQDDWLGVIDKFPYVFGKAGAAATAGAAGAAAPRSDAASPVGAAATAGPGTGTAAPAAASGPAPAAAPEEGPA